MQLYMKYGTKNKFCARRVAAWLFEADKFTFDVLAVGGIASSESLRKNMLNTAMVRMMAVVMTVRETRGQGRFAMMPDDFKSHMREAEAFLLHCKSCPAKQTKRMKVSERNAAPKEMPRMDVFGNTRTCTIKMQKKMRQAQVT
jgi:hypothetical protein